MLTLSYANGQQGRVLVDWLSLSIPVILAQGIPHQQRGAATIRATSAALGFDWSTMTDLHDIREVKCGQGWSEAYMCPQAGMRVDTRGNGASLIAFSGTGCEWLRKVKELERMVKLGGTHASRLDIALDKPTTKLPSDIVDINMDTSKYQISLMRSKTGETVYLGSMTGNKFARLYKFTDPAHERVGVMRLETVFRDKGAKAMCELVTAGQILSIVRSEVNRLGLQELLEGALLDEEETIKVITYVKLKHANTIEWLKRSVVPALIRLEDEGELPDAIAFLETLMLAIRQEREIA